MLKESVQQDVSMRRKLIPYHVHPSFLNFVVKGRLARTAYDIAR
jgi:hypothetical protein